MSNDNFSFQLTKKPDLIPSSVSGNKNGKRYLLIGIVTNVIIWSCALLYLILKSPTYTSQWAIALPRTELFAKNVDVPGVGQSSSQSESLYNTQNADPRENYKFLAGTDEVLRVAARKLDMSAEEFGKPQVEIVTNATMMQFEIEGDTAQQAQKKAKAFHQAFKDRLEELRTQETTQQKRNLESSLSRAKQKLQTAQQRLSEYKASSGLSSSNQVDYLSEDLEQLRKQRSETLAQLKQVSARLRQKSRTLNLSPQQAGDAFVLKSDSLFQQYLANYSQASAELNQLEANFLPEYPPLKQQKAEKEAAQAALLKRAQLLLEESVTLSSLQQLNLISDGSSSKAALLNDLISLKEQQQGLQAQVQELGNQIEKLESRLATLSQQNAKLSSLQQDVKVADAIFTSTLTELETSNSNLISYPSISLLTKPTLPQEPSSPKTIFVLLGASFGSLFLTMGIIMLWLRNRRLTQTRESLQNY